MELSVVIPIKDEKDNIKRLHERLCEALEPTRKSFELILVDDGSTDGSYELLEELASRDPRVKVVQLRRNFGQTAAMQAGIDWAVGDILITMDGDLQNDPDDIPMLVDKLNEGYDAVLGERANRQDHFWIRKFPSLIANWVIRKVTGVPIRDMGCTLRALRHDVAKGLPLYGEMHRFIPVLAQQYGSRMVQVPVKHHPRTAGKTKYNLTRTFRVMLDLITLKFMHSYMTRPMHVMGFAGMVSIGLGMLSFFITGLMKLFAGEDMTGNPLLLLSVGLTLIGVQFISMGLIGEIVTRTYFESQDKKYYTIRNTLNFDEEPLTRRAA